MGYTTFSDTPTLQINQIFFPDSTPVNLGSCERSLDSTARVARKTTLAVLCGTRDLTSMTNGLTLSDHKNRCCGLQTARLWYSSHDFRRGFSLLHCFTLFYIALHCVTLVYIGLHCFTLVYIVLHCFTLLYMCFQALLPSILTTCLERSPE